MKVLLLVLIVFSTWYVTLSIVMSQSDGGVISGAKKKKGPKPGCQKLPAITKACVCCQKIYTGKADSKFCGVPLENRNRSSLRLPKPRTSYVAAATTQATCTSTKRPHYSLSANNSLVETQPKKCKYSDISSISADQDLMNLEGLSKECRAEKLTAALEFIQVQ